MANIAPNLAQLAKKINAEHTAALRAARTCLKHARRAGELLAEAKEHCGHGKWLPWLEANVEFTPRTAQRYMRLAERWPELEANATAPSHLTIEDGLKLLADPDDESERQQEAERIGGAAVDPDVLLELETPRQMEDFVAAVKDAKIPKTRHRAALEEVRHKFVAGVSRAIGDWWYVESGRQARDDKRAAEEAAERHVDMTPYRAAIRLTGKLDCFLSDKRDADWEWIDLLLKVKEEISDRMKGQIRDSIIRLETALAELKANLAVQQQPIRIVDPIEREGLPYREEGE
jgi:hypothetical protein